MSSSDRDTRTTALQNGPVYEQPLNERMRTFLRLDFLYQQTLYHEEHEDPWSTRAAVSSLLDILAITARGDIRSEVLKELERQMTIMHEYQSRPGVDAARLNSVLSNLARLRAELLAAGALFMQRLRDSEFLNAIKHRSSIPGGTCEFDLPDYRHWLDQPFEVRSAAFADWMSTIRPLCDAVTELLWLTRQSARPRPEVATRGTFQVVFDRDTPSQLLRITLPPGTSLFPEISGSHHRCSIRFMNWIDVNQRPVQTTEDVNFLLTVCA
ncbi:MAG: cell division protein ZapD [Gammaproteobacteria bacterium]|nr:cell division protein ZapD [Gammaproteobacteria bacterium]